MIAAGAAAAPYFGMRWCTQNIAVSNPTKIGKTGVNMEALHFATILVFVNEL